MKPPGLIVGISLLALVYAGLVATRINPLPVQVVEPFRLPVRPVVLNEDIVKRFLFGFAPVAATLRELDGKGEARQRVAILDAKAAEYGFANFADWQNTANTIMVTYHWITNPDPRQEVEKAMAAIPVEMGLSEKDKTAMLVELKAGLAQVENAKPAPANVAVVNRHLRSLKPFYALWLPLAH